MFNRLDRLIDKREEWENSVMGCDRQENQYFKTSFSGQN